MCMVSLTAPRAMVCILSFCELGRSESLQDYLLLRPGQILLWQLGSRHVSLPLRLRYFSSLPEAMSSRRWNLAGLDWAGRDDAVNVSNGESSVASAVADEVFVTTSTSGVASSPAVSGSFEITSTSTSLAFSSGRGKPSSRVYLWTHFLTEEEISAATKHCYVAQTELATLETSDHAAWSYARNFFICYRPQCRVLPCSNGRFEWPAVLHILQVLFGD